MFGRSVTNSNVEMIVDLINKATGSELNPEFSKLGQETLRLEAQFNKDAGFQIKMMTCHNLHDEPLAPRTGGSFRSRSK